MTAPNGAIKFNNLTGSDTQSSGLGPAVAVYGSGASTTGASNVVTGINTAGVSSGDLLWVQSSSGRQFSIIATVDSGSQVTCDDNFDNTESGRTWAIGGKRATLDSVTSLFESNYSFQKTFELSLETDQNAGNLSPNGAMGVSIHIKSSVPGVKRELMCTDTYPFYGGSWYLYDLSVKSNYSGTRLLGRGSNTATVLDVYVRAYDCDFADATYNFTSLNDYYRGFMHFYKCNFKNFSSSIWTQRQTVTFQDCYFSDNQSYIIAWNGAGSNSLHVNNCIFTNNANWMWLGRGLFNGISDCVIHGTTGTLMTSTTGGVHQQDFIRNCIFSDNSGSFTGAVSQNTLKLMNCAFYNNANMNASSGSVYSYGNIDLTADPFVNAANGDFNINNAAGGGAVLRSTKYTLGG
jgi:hypothetical protein